MNWRLLDIRTGRANRLQFLLYGGGSLVAMFIIYFMKLPLTIIVILMPLCLYVFFIILNRRLHDLGYDLFEKEVKKSADLFGTYINDFYYQKDDYLFYSILIEGQKTENIYGFPPEGVSILSMLSNKYTEKQKRDPEITQLIKLQENKNNIQSLEQFEFKGR